MARPTRILVIIDFFGVRLLKTEWMTRGANDDYFLPPNF